MKLAHYSFIDLSILGHNHKRQVVKLYHHIIMSVGFLYSYCSNFSTGRRFAELELKLLLIQVSI